jgi:hypothetical protein
MKCESTRRIIRRSARRGSSIWMNNMKITGWHFSWHASSSRCKKITLSIMVMISDWMPMPTIPPPVPHIPLNNCLGEGKDEEEEDKEVEWREKE